MSSFALTSRLALRRCGGRRFTSSEAPERVQSHAPVSTDFGGIHIRPPPRLVRFVRDQARQAAMDRPPVARQVRGGELAEGGALSRFQARFNREDARADAASAEPMTQGDHPRSLESQARRDTNSSLSHVGEVEQGRGQDGEQRAWRRTDMTRRQYRPDRDMMQTRRTSRPGSGSAPTWRRRRRPSREMEEQEWEEDEGGDYAETTDHIIVLESGRPDAPLPKRGPTLPPPLTNLETRVDARPTKARREEAQGGDYTRYFSRGQLEGARAQTTAPLGVVDRARLALAFNQTVGLKDKGVAIEMVEKKIMGSAVTE